LIYADDVYLLGENIHSIKKITQTLIDARLRIRLESFIKTVVRKVKCNRVNIILAHNRVQWWILITAVVNILHVTESD
jgi:hypothetical protein